MAHANNQKPEISDPSYQDRDINLKVVMVSIVLILITALFSGFAMKALFQAYNSHMYLSQDVLSPLKGERELPSVSRLQVNEAADLRAYRLHQEAQLAQYRWIDEAAGTVAIPVEHAMDRLLETGALTPDLNAEEQ